MMIMLLSGCIGQEEEEEKVVVIGTTQAVDTFDTAIGTSWLTYLVSNFAGDSLAQFAPPDVTESAPWLATSWTVSDDAKTWIFTLREGVKFHDGTDMNAEAVEASIKHVIDTNMGMAGFLKPIETMTILDTHKIQFDLNEGNVLLIKILSMALMVTIVSPTAMEEAGDDWGKTTFVSTGPYKFVEWIAGDRVVLEKDPDWWGIDADLPSWAPEAKVDKIILKLFTDASAARIALETGEIDIYWKYPNPADIPTLKDNPNINTQVSRAGYLRQIYFNQRPEWPMLQDKRVRQAIAYGIDVEEVFNLGFQGDGKLVYSTVHSFFTPYYKPVFEKYKHDPVKAKELLTAAGYGDGFTIDWIYTDLHWDILDKNVCEIIQSNLAEIGITVNIVLADWATYVERFSGGDFPIGMMGWLLDYPDPDNTMMQVVHPDFGWINTGPTGGAINWKSDSSADTARFAELGNMGRVETDLQKRIDIYKEAQDIYAEEVPIYPLKESNIYAFSRTWVKDFTLYSNDYANKLSILAMDIDKGTEASGLALLWFSPAFLMLAAVLPSGLRPKDE